MSHRVRLAQLGALTLAGAISVGVGLGLSAGGGASSPSIGTNSTTPTLPDQVPVVGPNGYEGTVPKSVFTNAPPLNAAGVPVPVSQYPGASIVVNNHAGYAVIRNGVLTGYWVPGPQPSTFVSVAQAQSEGAVPSQGASPVGTTTAVTPTAPNPVPTP
jgi:hypothetical protein